MKLEDLEKEWETDSEIDRTNLQNEYVRLGKLHSKYAILYNKEKARLLQLKGQHDVLYKDILQKLSYDTGPDKKMTTEEREKNPSGIKPLKTDVDKFIQADKSYIAISLDYGLQQIKVDFIKYILDHISKRNFIIQGLTKQQMFEAGL